MRNAIGVLGVCLVFLFGMIAGAALTIHVERVHADQLFLSGRLGSTMAERVTRRLTHQLDCDPRQREQIRDILLDAQRDMREARRQIAPQLQRVFFRAADQVRGVLRGEQVKTFDEIMARIRARQSSAGALPSATPSVPPPEAKAP